ncbi:MAG: AAA family ATPase [Dehalococcoidia bacterium]|nr:AAA family ATPase [Dehalococcoidia bacterium]
MPKTVTVAGKGGVGKTAIASLIIDLLSRKGVVLAIDADPSTNLNIALGLTLDDNATVGRAREDLTADIQKGKIAPNISKQDILDMKIHESLVESSKIDLLAMGRPEGPGCYCAANNWLRASIDRLEKNYDYIVVDSEAGMEHISRQTTQDVDNLIIVTDPTMRGLITAVRTRDLITEMRTRVGKVGLVVNRVKNGLPAELDQAIKDYNLTLLAVIPEDPNLAELDIKGGPIIDLPQDSPLKIGAQEVVNKLNL